MLSFALYIIGSVACIAGLAWIATLLGAAQTYVMPTAGLLLAIAIFSAATSKRGTQPSPR